MSDQTETIQNYLRVEFERRVRANPRYSLRAFARALNLSSGALSEILRNQRPVTLKMGSKIAKALGLGDNETREFFELIDSDRRDSFADQVPLKSSEIKRQRQLDEDTFRLISDWQHFAILNLIDCAGFRWNAKYVSRRLGLGEAEAQMAMNLLMRVGLVVQKGSKVVCAEDYVLSSTDIPSSAIRSYHRQILMKAAEALELQNIEERDITGSGFSLDPRHLPKIKREISEFQDRLIQKYSRGERHEVYFFETALFRLTARGT